MISQYLDPLMKYVGVGLAWFRGAIPYFDIIFLFLAFFLSFKITRKFTTTPFSKGFVQYYILISIMIYLLLMYI